MRTKSNKGQFKAGKSGNPNGRPRLEERSRIVRMIIKAGAKALQSEDPESDLLEKIWLQAMAGSFQHQKLLMEYMNGKPEENINVTDKPAPTIYLQKAE